jgi:hypothetical protein
MSSRLLWVVTRSSTLRAWWLIGIYHFHLQDQRVSQAEFAICNFWFLSWLTLRSWRWRWYIPMNHQTLFALKDVTDQHLITFVKQTLFPSQYYVLISQWKTDAILLSAIFLCVVIIRWFNPDLSLVTAFILCVLLLFSSLNMAGRSWQRPNIYVYCWQRWPISIFDRKTYNFRFCCEKYRIFRTFILLHKFYSLTRFRPLKYFLFLAKLLLHNFPWCRGSICINRRGVTAIHLQVYISILIQRNEEKGNARHHSNS